MRQMIKEGPILEEKIGAGRFSAMCSNRCSSRSAWRSLRCHGPRLEDRSLLSGSEEAMALLPSNTFSFLADGWDESKVFKAHLSWSRELGRASGLGEARSAP